MFQHAHRPRSKYFGSFDLSEQHHLHKFCVNEIVDVFQPNLGLDE